MDYNKTIFILEAAAKMHKFWQKNHQKVTFFRWNIN